MPASGKPERWVVPLSYSDVFGRKPTRDNLTDFVRALPCRDLVVKCSAIALLSWQRGIEDPKHQADLVHNLLVHNPTYAGKIQDYEPRHAARPIYARDFVGHDPRGGR